MVRYLEKFSSGISLPLTRKPTNWSFMAISIYHTMTVKIFFASEAQSFSTFTQTFLITQSLIRTAVSF